MRIFNAAIVASLFLFASESVSAPPHWGSSSITPELIAYCDKAEGIAKVFGGTKTDTCAEYLNSAKLREGMALTASCDCGEDKCLKDDKCVKNPSRLLHWLFGE